MKINWDLFDKQYPIKNGVVNTLPPELAKKYIRPDLDAHTFDVVHNKVMKDRTKAEFLKDKEAMADMQMDFYDRMAAGFQGMDDNDQASGGIFWWKIRRLAKYDASVMKGKSILFVGAGNGRLIRFFASKGFNVVATDISRNMLEVGIVKNKSLGINDVTYVAQNAEIRFPFKDETFDNIYSLCVMNHITDWNNYITEKMRCLKPGGVLLERLPNASLWQFWKMQGVLYEGVEIKAAYCNPDTVKAKLQELDISGEVWTHDHQVNQTPIGRNIRIPVYYSVYLIVNQLLYNIRSFLEDYAKLGRNDGNGIYTMIKIVKTKGDIQTSIKDRIL